MGRPVKTAKDTVSKAGTSKVPEIKPTKDTLSKAGAGSLPAVKDSINKAGGINPSPKAVKDSVKSPVKKPGS